MTPAPLETAMSIDLDVLEGLLLESPGPWKACGTIYEHMNCEVRSGAKGEGQAIAQVWDGPNAFKAGQLIVAAVNALPDLVAAARERDGLREALIEIEQNSHYQHDTTDEFDRGAKAARLDAAQIARQALQAGEKG